MPRRHVLLVSEILKWADALYERTGKWPTVTLARVAESPDEKWSNINAALHNGYRGLPSGHSLPQLLAKHRGVRNRKALPKYTHKQILAWADAHYKRTGDWPKITSGPIVDASGETWKAVGVALQQGLRGLKGGASLAQLLQKHRKASNWLDRPRLTKKKIVSWARKYRKRHGVWPNQRSGVVDGSHEETWRAIQVALRVGYRGLPGGSSLFQLLQKIGR